MKRIRVGMVFLIVLAGTIGNAWAEEYMLVCNPAVRQSQLEPAVVKRIFLGKQTRWEDGSPIRFVLLKGKRGDAFLKQYIHKNEAQYRKFWKKKLFTGKGSMPPFLRKPSEVVQYVAMTKGALGFVPEGTRSDGVKILSVSN